MQSKSRQRQAAIRAKRDPKPWELERDDDLEDKGYPEPEEDDPPPSNTFH